MGPANQRLLWRFARQILETVRREANVAGAVRPLAKPSVNYLNLL